MGNINTKVARAAWAPADLMRDSGWRIEVPAAAVHALTTKVKSLQDRPLEAIGPEDALLPELEEAANKAAQQLFDADGIGFAVLTNLPTEGLTESEAERLYSIIGYQFGIPVTQSRAADIVAHVRN
jgi:hypothetical protein